MHLASVEFETSHIPLRSVIGVRHTCAREGMPSRSTRSLTQAGVDIWVHGRLSTALYDEFVRSCD